MYLATCCMLWQHVLAHCYRTEHMYLQTSDMLHDATCVGTLLQDGAYAVWQRMVKAGVVPDEVTQRILVQCFRNNLQMASALVKEARQMMVRCTPILSLQSCYHTVSIPLNKLLIIIQFSCNRVCLWHNRTPVTSMPGRLIASTPGLTFCTHQASNYLANLSVKSDLYTKWSNLSVADGSRS